MKMSKPSYTVDVGIDAARIVQPPPVLREIDFPDPLGKDEFVTFGIQYMPSVGLFK